MTIPETPKKTEIICHGYEGLGGERLVTLNGKKQFRYYPYQGKADRPSVWTIGRGHVCSLDELNRWSKTGLSLEEVDSLFVRDMMPRAERLHKALKGKYTADQFAGALSLFYNYEATFWTGDTGRLHNLGDYTGAAKNMLKIINSNGQRQRGLWRRRMSEALCYLTGEVIVAKDSQTEKRLFNRLKLVIPSLVEPANLK